MAMSNMVKRKGTVSQGRELAKMMNRTRINEEKNMKRSRQNFKIKVVLLENA